MNEAVRAMRVGKSQGLNGVCVEMLRVIYRVIPEWLKRMYDVCLQTGSFSEVWKSARESDKFC